MIKSYKTILDYSQAEFVEKKSKFITYIMPVSSESEATSFIASIKKKHYDAAHNCSAFVLGYNCEVMRSSDDGEPSGTAGIPILEVLKKESLTNVVIVVTRYFGGILLGAGGLIRAYTEAAVNGIKAATAISVQQFNILKVSIDYTFLNKLQYEIAKTTYILGNIDYNDIVTLQIFVQNEKTAEAESSIMEWTNGAALIESAGDTMLKIDIATNKVLI